MAASRSSTRPRRARMRAQRLAPRWKLLVTLLCAGLSDAQPPTSPAIVSFAVNSGGADQVTVCCYAASLGLRCPQAHHRQAIHHAFVALLVVDPRLGLTQNSKFVCRSSGHSSTLPQPSLYRAARTPPALPQRLCRARQSRSARLASNTCYPTRRQEDGSRLQ